MNYVGIDLVLQLIFVSFVMFLLDFDIIKCLWDSLRLLCDYHHSFQFNLGTHWGWRVLT